LPKIFLRWAGCRDWDIRDFHGYSTYEGSTYNAFLILDEKNVLIDTVKAEFADELLDNISQIIEPSKIDLVISNQPSKIDLVISNHTEMDHSGSLPKVMDVIGMDKPVYCSKMGFKNLQNHFSNPFNYHPVKNNEELNIGKRVLTFMETRMLHWPDSMFTYLKEEKILFSSDAFGQHYAGDATFDDEAGENYANILLNYSSRVQQLLKSVADAGMEFDMICPDHGILWRNDPGAIISAYDRWSRHETEEKALVIFDSMWKSTAKMARQIARGVASGGSG